MPVGGYTITVLRKMGLSSVLSKVVSRESDVRAVTGKIALGQARRRLRLRHGRERRQRPGHRRPDPAWAQPRVRYEIAVVTRSTDKAAARALINAVLSAKGQTALRNAGFLPIPKSAS